MKNIKKVVLVAVACVAGNSMAFDTATHAAMTATAAGKSRIGISPTFSAQIQSLGLRDSLVAIGDKYIDIGPQLTTRLGSGFEGRIINTVFEANRDGLITIPTPYTLTGWLMRGAIREDDNNIEVPLEAQDEPGGTFKRVYAHFHDPQNNRGLTFGLINVGPRARDWATISGANVSGRENHYTTEHAREAMWRALTLTARAADGTYNNNVTPSDWTPPSKEHLRKAYWATTFRALGDVVHLIQDMAQPQHTRNDMHSGFGCVPFVGACVAGHDSFIEKYLKARTLRARAFRLKEGPAGGDEGQPIAIAVNPLNYTSYNVVPTFAEYSDFFTSRAADGGNANGKGLANYSNRGFYSAGTLNTAEQPSPQPGGSSFATLELNGITPINGEYLRDMTGNILPGRMTFRIGTVRDSISGLDANNVKLSSTGVWDQFLQQKGFLTKGTLNYYNYDEQARLLIPRAVAYSAGLIDYFFRGVLEVTPPDEGVYSLIDHSDRSGANAMATDAANGFKGFKTFRLKLRNATPDIIPSGTTTPIAQTMSGGKLVGVLKFYRNLAHTDDLANEPVNATAYGMSRSSAEEIVVSSRVRNAAGMVLPDNVLIDNAATPQTYQFEFDQELPINAVDIKLQVVYRGALGSEGDAVVVETVDISEPSYVTYLNTTDYIQLGNSFYTRGDVNMSPALLSQVRPTTLIDNMTGQLKNTSLVPIPLTFIAKIGNATSNASVGVNLLNDKTYHRLAMLIPPGATGTINWILASSGCGYNSLLDVPRRVVQTDYTTEFPAGFTLVSPLLTTRGTNSLVSVSCILNGDNLPHPELLTEAQSASLAVLQGANQKPLPFISFTFGTP